MSRPGPGSRSTGRIQLAQSCEAARPRFLQIAADYAWLNPHLTLDGRLVRRATSGARRRPTGLDEVEAVAIRPRRTGTRRRLERLVAAYIAHDADRGRTAPCASSSPSSAACSGTAKQKAVLDATGLARAPLSALVNGSDLDHGTVASLLEAMQASSKPVKPAAARASSAATTSRRGSTPPAARWRASTTAGSWTPRDGVPWVVETAFGWCPELERRLLVTGVNWSPGIVNPFRELGRFGESLDTILSQQRADRDEPVILVLHMACPRVEYTDRGKSRGGGRHEGRQDHRRRRGRHREWAKQRKARGARRRRRGEPALRHDPAPDRHDPRRRLRDHGGRLPEGQRQRHAAGARPPGHVRRAAATSRSTPTASSATSSTSTSRSSCCPTTSRRTASATGTSSTTRAATSPSRTPRRECRSAHCRSATTSAGSASTRSEIPTSTSGSGTIRRSGRATASAPILFIEKEGFMPALRGGEARRALRPRDHVHQGHERHRGPGAGRGAVRASACRSWCSTTSTSAGFSIVGTLRRTRAGYRFGQATPPG